MAHIIHGTKLAVIRYDEFLVRCPHCEAHVWAEAAVSAQYYHIYCIPLFPVGKEVYLVCQKCGLKRDGLQFDATLISNFDEIKRKFRYPWYAYFGILIFGGLLITGIISLIFD